ncbi:MAG: ferredoxin--NADP reductase [Deltaproteobacteria bacterium]|nr:ferredoxin--NADP reductase [Deltaproteobacteria bacterium]
MPSDFHKLQIAGIIQETHDTRSYILAVPESLRKEFRYRAGQFLTFEVPWEGMQLRRCYSLSSAPGIDPWPKVTVKRVDDGRVSNWFNDSVRVGDSILVQPPEGRFSMRSNEGDHGIVLFGGGSGVTPVLSILKSALRTTERDVKLIYANRDERSIIFKDEIDLWLAEFPKRLEAIHHLDSDSGFMSVADVQEHIRGWEDAEFFVCGPTGYMDTVEEAFKASDIDAVQTKFERFISPIDADRKDESAVVVPEQSDDEIPEPFKMLLESQSHDVPYEKGLTLLASAIKAGHKPPSSCEDGYCGCCMALLKSGKVNMANHDALEPSDIERGWVLPCQARPSSQEPIEIDFDAEY